jgi:hypothetical protein
MWADDKHSTAPVKADHLSDDQLMEICFPETDSRHLATCDPCRSRYDDLVRRLDELREEAIAEADARFPSERLAEQRSAVLRRLEHTRHAADVVAFPARWAHAPAEWRTPGPARRWVAAAAAAGLVAGLLVGRFVDLGSRALSSGASRVAVSEGPRATVAPPAAASPSADDNLLVEIEDAVTSRRVVELRALDALTSPELREISLDVP